MVQDQFKEITLACWKQKIKKGRVQDICTMLCVTCEDIKYIQHTHCSTHRNPQTQCQQVSIALLYLSACELLQTC